MTDVMDDIGEISGAHAERLRAIDPLLPEPAPLDPGEGERLLVARAGRAVAAGATKRTVLDRSTLAATWGALRQHRLRVRLAGPEPEAALSDLLDQWDEHLATVSAAGHEDEAAVVAWPSRDTEAVRALTRHGFAPLIVAAVRKVGPVDPSPPAPGLSVRRAASDDVAVCTRLGLEIIRHDQRFGVVTERPSSRAKLEESMVTVLGRPQPWAWLAERDGEPVGMLLVERPEHSAGVAAMTSASPVSFVDSLVVTPGSRGRGVGSALVAEGHRAVREAGVSVTLLYHALPNPLSTPFWYRHGYRPLWTYWHRRPVW